MMTMSRWGASKRSAASLMVSLISTVGMSACSDDAGGPLGEDPGATAGASALPPGDSRSTGTYVGPNSTKFTKWADHHHNSIATVTGPVQTVLNSHAFTLAGVGDATDLLVVGKGRVTNLKAGDRVAVTGAVHKAFNLPTVEAKTHVDLGDDSVLQGFDQAPYIQATNTALK